MPFSLRSPSLRGRLILLVLALWLPAVAGLGLQAYEAYQTQKRALQDEIQQQAMALRVAIDAGIERRYTLAKALTSLSSLQTGDLATFERTARGAVRDSRDAVLLVDREQVYFYTGAPGRAPVARRADALFVESGMGIYFAEKGPLSGTPAVAVLVAEDRTPPRFNVGVPYPLERIQEVIAQQRWRDGTVAAVVDSQQRLMGRNREPQRWIGARASDPRLRELMAARQGGFLRTLTLDKVASLTYLTPPGRHGWSAVVALPEKSLVNAAWQLALQAVAASAVLLVVGLGLALLAARRISAPVQALEQAASELVQQRVPLPLQTGVREVDRVGAVLRDAGLRSRQWNDILEARVREASEEARKAEANLFDARKHETIGRLTGAIAHDFNNLLQTITMGLQVVNRSVPEGRHTRALQAALAAAGRAADQVRQMLAFGRAQQLHPRPVKLADLLLQSKDLTDKALGERVQFAAEFDPELPAMQADPVQLELALLNLVFNARDAMAGSGTLRLGAAVVEGEAVGLPARQFVRIDVQDDGHGMDPATLERVFEPYFTTKPIGAGTGLGLAQVQAFARESGGDVRIASTVGQGTCVSLLLPVADGEAVHEHEAPAKARRTPRALRILMAEDDVLVASVVVMALEHEGHTVTLCRTADEAQARLAAGGSFDVLFTDVMMPGTMTGLELVAWTQEKRPELPALVATGYSARAPEGPWKLLRKPYTIEDLLDAIAACSDSAPTLAA